MMDSMDSQHHRLIHLVFHLVIQTHVAPSMAWSPSQESTKSLMMSLWRTKLNRLITLLCTTGLVKRNHVNDQHERCPRTGGSFVTLACPLTYQSLLGDMRGLWNRRYVGIIRRQEETIKGPYVHSLSTDNECPPVCPWMMDGWIPHDVGKVYGEELLDNKEELFSLGLLIKGAWPGGAFTLMVVSGLLQITANPFLNPRMVFV